MDRVCNRTSKRDAELHPLISYKGMVRFKPDSRLGFRGNKACQLRGGLATDAEPVTEIMVKGQSELLAGLHQAEHGVARNMAVSVHGATRYLSPGDEAARSFCRT